jgi:hypothetical protein
VSWGYVAAPELPRAKSRSRGDTWQPRSCLSPGGRSWSRCLDSKLVRGGTRSSGYQQWPRVHPGRGCEPTGGANILFPCSLSESCTLGF